MVSLDQRKIIGLFTIRSPELNALMEGYHDAKRSVDVSEGSPRSMILTADNTRYYSAMSTASLARRMTRFRRKDRAPARENGEDSRGTEVAR